MYFVFGLAEDTSYPLTVESALTQMLEGATFSLVFICKETGAVQISPRSEPSVFVTSSSPSTGCQDLFLQALLNQKYRLLLLPATNLDRNLKVLVTVLVFASTMAYHPGKMMQNRLRRRLNIYSSSPWSHCGYYGFRFCNSPVSFFNFSWSFFTHAIIFVLIAQKVPLSHHSQLWYCLLSIWLIDLHLIVGPSVCSSLVCFKPVNSTNSKHCMYSNVIQNPVDSDASTRRLVAIWVVQK